MRWPPSAELNYVGINIALEARRKRCQAIDCTRRDIPCNSVIEQVAPIGPIRLGRSNGGVALSFAMQVARFGMARRRRTGGSRMGGENTMHFSSVAANALTSSYLMMHLAWLLDHRTTD
jgi:hypothetical protein